MSESGSRAVLRDYRTLALAAVLALFVACDTPAPVESDLETGADAAETSGTVARTGDAIELGEPPLVVVDGVVWGRGAEVEMLDGSQIESLEAVKGAAAERLYGERGADGVIQITTKDAGDGGG